MLLRQLSVLYLAAASSFGVAIVLSQHPMLNSAAKTGVHFTVEKTGEAAIAANTYVIQPSWSWTKSETGDLVHRAQVAMNPPPASPAPVQVAQQPKPVVKQAVKKVALVPAPVHKNPAPAPAKVAVAEPPVLRPQILEPPARPDVFTPPQVTIVPKTDRTPVPPIAQSLPPAPTASAPAPSPAELIRVTKRLQDSLTSEMLQHFDMFLYVSKADHGPWAQRMYVFQKQPDNGLLMLYNWPVSTGREKIEIAPSGAHAPSYTPAGYYEIDPDRMYTHYASMQWHQPMPYAMFFNWENHGFQTGLAIHAASGEDIALLGTRSSAGCVRLAPENARVLFTLIRANYKGLMPKFAYDKRTATMANDGMLLHDASGHVQMTGGYKVLVFIEDYGGEQVVAALF